MAGKRRGGGGPAHGAQRRFPRTARVNRVLQEVVAEELEMADDPRLGLLTVVDVEVSTDLHDATVWYTWLPGEADGTVAAPLGPPTAVPAADPDAEARAERDTALAELEPHIRAEVNRQVRLRAIPKLHFREDPAAQAGARVEAILRDLDIGPDVGDAAEAGTGPGTTSGTGDDAGPVGGT